LITSHAQQTSKDDNALTVNNYEKFSRMPIHDTIKLIATGIADISSLPAMGPSDTGHKALCPVSSR
jgi:hypothetical protein